MAKSAASPFPVIIGIVEIKSKFDADIRRFSIDASKTSQFDDFYLLLEQLHHLVDIPFIVTYTDPRHMDLLPINNNDNFSWALAATKGILKVVIQRKGESYGEVNGYAAQPVKKRNPISKLVSAETSPRPKITISLMEDFRRVSAIIDVDIVPETHRRVKLMKNGSDKPLGFYIRDGTSVRMTPHGLEKVPAIFISRLVPGGLAESTGLLAVNDEVLEVNGIEVAGKKLDQVTDMMVANSSNLIITVKPVNQRMTLATQRGGLGRHSNISSTSHASHQSQASNVSVRSYGSEQLIPEGDDDDDDDEVQDHLSPTLPPPGVLVLDEASGGMHVQLRDDSEDGRKQGSGGKGARPKSSAGSKGALAVSSSEGGDKDSDPIVTL